MVGNFSQGADSVRYVQLNENDNERSKPITSTRNRNPSQMCKRISCYAELVVRLINQVILTAQNADESANDRLIERGKDDITKKLRNM